MASTAGAWLDCTLAGCSIKPEALLLFVMRNGDVAVTQETGSDETDERLTTEAESDNMWAAVLGIISMLPTDFGQDWEKLAAELPVELPAELPRIRYGG